MSLHVWQALRQFGYSACPGGIDGRPEAIFVSPSVCSWYGRACSESPFELADLRRIRPVLDCTRAPAIDGIPLVLPTRNAFPQHLHIPVPLLLEELVGQTGLMDRARSIEDDQPLPRDLADPLLKFGERHVDGAPDM